MTAEECYAKIQRYINSEDYSPRIINVENKHDLQAVKQKFMVDSIHWIAIEDFARDDKSPKLDEIERTLSNSNGIVFLAGLTTYLKLLGEKTIIKELNIISSNTYNAHIIVLCYMCKSFLTFKDLRKNRLVYLIDGETDETPNIVFTISGLSQINGIKPINGIQDIPKEIETSCDTTIYVSTTKNKLYYPESLLIIKDEKSAFEVIKHIDSDTNALSEDLGTNDDWLLALKKLTEFGSWKNLFDSVFNVTTNLSLILNNWKSFSLDQKWFYFIALKMYGSGHNKYLNQAVNKAKDIDNLMKYIYRDILEIATSNSDYWKIYDLRKKVITDIGVDEEQVIEYLKFVAIKDEKALYYLTDTCKLEKQKILEMLAKYADTYSREEIEQLLLNIYPCLFYYLQPYDFKNKMIYDYFNDYKYQKVTNQIYPEFLNLVKEQAKKRDYNRLLSTRAEIVDNIDKSGIRLYFVDAMGVEYLSFILYLCSQSKLMANISICRCNLPSITKFNKEFIDEFSDIAPNIKRLDDIKHHGEESFNYQQTKLPYHLIRELEIISELINDIKSKLLSGEIEKACIISDHGSSRLAVINEQENQWEMSSKGEHSGRCCPIGDADVKSEYSTQENDFWVLANYDRFKGSRKACVEVHGGATLEEVTVPIIEITYIKKEIEITIASDLPILVSFRKKAEITLFSNQKLSNVTVYINGKNVKDKKYFAEEITTNQYKIMMPDVKRAGEYSMEILSNNNPIANLIFMVKQEGSSERSIL